MKCWISPYKLYPQTHLNAQVNQGERAGALVKVEFDIDRVGYADFHQPELLAGLNQFDNLKTIRSSANSIEFRRSIEIAKRDADESYLFDSNLKIRNHFLITDIESFSYLDFLFYESNGFNRFKVKMGRSLRKETNALKELVEKSSANTYFRLDFNASVDKADFKLWIKKNSPWLLKKLDLIEDPVNYDPDYWRFLQTEYGIQVALDLEADPLQVKDDGSFSVVVVKPAVQNEEDIINKYKDSSVKFLWTHYMDHPLGQASAISSAFKAQQKLGTRLLDCGLLGANLYQDLDANKYIHANGPELSPINEPAWGFNSYLKELKWFPLD